jgi:hypothetical protein
MNPAVADRVRNREFGSGSKLHGSFASLRMTGHQVFDDPEDYLKL